MKRVGTSRMKFAALFAVLVVLTQLSACGPGVAIRASEEFAKKNPVQSITVLVAGRTVWPPITWRDPAIGLQSSKQALETIAPILRSTLSKKGYAVDVREVAVLPVPAYKENWVIPNDIEIAPQSEEAALGSAKSTNQQSNDESLRPYQLKNDALAFVYPLFENDRSSVASTIGVFAYLDRTNVFKISDSTLASADATNGNQNVSDPASHDDSQTRRLTPPSREVLKTLYAKFDSDLLCFAKFDGIRFSLARKVVSIVTTLPFVVNGVPGTFATDQGWITMACYDRSSEVAWASHKRIGPQKKPEPSLIIHFLDFFPAKGQSLGANCKSDDVQLALYNCTRPSR